MHRMYYRIGGGPSFGGYYMGLSNMSLGGWLLMVGVIALGIAIVVLLALNLANSRKRNKSSEALEILNNRYASGEIDKETYDTIKKDLR